MGCITTRASDVVTTPVNLFEFVQPQRESGSRTRMRSTSRRGWTSKEALYSSLDHLGLGVPTVPELNEELRVLEQGLRTGLGAGPVPHAHTPSSHLVDEDFIDESGMPLGSGETLLLGALRMLARCGFATGSLACTTAARKASARFVAYVQTLRVTGQCSQVHPCVAKAFVNSVDAITHPDLGKSSQGTVVPALAWSLLYAVYVGRGPDDLDTKGMPISHLDDLTLTHTADRHALMTSCVGVVIRSAPFASIMSRSTRVSDSDTTHTTHTAHTLQCVLTLLTHCVLPGLPPWDVLPVVSQVLTVLTAASSVCPEVVLGFLKGVSQALVFDDDPSFSPLAIVNPMWTGFLRWAACSTFPGSNDTVVDFVDMFRADSYYGIGSSLAVDLVNRWRAAGCVVVDVTAGTVRHVLTIGSAMPSALHHIPKPTPTLLRLVHDVIHDQRGWLELE